MIVFFLVLLLLVFLAGFFGLETYAQNVMQASDIRILGISLLSSEFRAFLGIGVLFLEFAVILFSMLDRIGDTIREIIRLAARLLPFGLFLTSIWKTFAPVLQALLPNEILGQIGMASENPAPLTQVVTGDGFSEGVLLTLGTMALFIITTYALNRPSPTVVEVKRPRTKVTATRES